MIKVVKAVLCIGITIILLVGCSKHPELVYRDSHNGNKLVVRPPLTRRFIENTFVLPNVGKFVPNSIEPPKT